MRLIDDSDGGADLYQQRDGLPDGTRGWTYLERKI